MEGDAAECISSPKISRKGFTRICPPFLQSSIRPSSLSPSSHTREPIVYIVMYIHVPIIVPITSASNLVPAPWRPPERLSSSRTHAPTNIGCFPIRLSYRPLNIHGKLSERRPTKPAKKTALCDDSTKVENDQQVCYFNQPNSITSLAFSNNQR